MSIKYKNKTIAGVLTLDNAPTSGNTDCAISSDAVYTALAEKASLDSPALTGTPTAPTATAGTNSTQIATTAFVQNANKYQSNPNLLDNWYFSGGGSQQQGRQFPINQRGATSYSAANYTMDRWVGGAATTQVTINANSIQFSSSTQDSVAYLMQYVEETLVGKTVTISAIIDGQLQVNTGTIAAETNLETTNLLLRTPTNGKTQFRFKVTSTTGVAIYAAKLEFGDQQTLAHNEGTTANPNWVLNEIPDYGIEVLKCETSIADNTDPESNLKAVTNKATFISSALDLNDYKQPGVYWWTNAPTNAPATSGIGSWLNGWLYVYKSDDGSRIMQEALYNPGSTGEISPVARMYANNNWGSWKTINDGASNLYYTSQTVSVASNAQILRIPASGTDSRITTDTIVLDCVFAAPHYITSNVTWQSYAGYIAFTGICTTATTANVTLGRKRN